MVEMKQGAHLGNLNWVTGLPTGGGRYFLHQPERRPELRMGRHASVTNRHLIDCTGTVTIGAFATLAGFQSQILTHSIDLAAGRQASEPVGDRGSIVSWGRTACCWGEACCRSGACWARSRC